MEVDMKRPLNDTAHVGHPEPTAASVVEDETKNANRQSMADKLEAIFERMADEMLHERGSISVMLKRRASTANGEDARVQSITFPGKNPEEAWRFAVIIRIMELMYDALRDDVVLSKRDIYYRDPALFGTQAHVDRYVDDIAFTFGVSRASMGVTAVAKGLMLGAVTFCRRDGSMTVYNGDREGMLVPSLRDILSVDVSVVKWILVIEKEATFRSVASSSFWTTHASEGVIVTAKGYPDIATRAMLHYLSTPSPQNGFASPPVSGLMDFDPDGLSILLTYKHGSKSLAHQSADLRVPSVQWLGLRSRHLMIEGDDTHDSQGLLTLSVRDRRKARHMLAQQHDSSRDGEVMEQRSELQHMLMLNVKAELQLLDATPSGMADLLELELRRLQVGDA